MQTLPGLLPTAAGVGQPSPAVLWWNQGSPSGFGSTAWDLHQSTPEAASAPWQCPTSLATSETPKCPAKPSANTDTGAASCTVLLLLTMSGFKVNYCSYPFIPMSCAGLPASACSLQCCFSSMQLFWFGCILWLWMDRQPKLL